jgi:polysaccharide biosynthesis transport protein
MHGQDEQISLRDYFNILRKRRLLLAVAVAGALAAAWLWTIMATPLYTSTTKVMIEKAGGNPLGVGYNYAYQEPEFYQTQFQLIRSRAVARRVVEMLGLDSITEASPTPGGRLQGGWRRITRSDSVADAPDFEWVRRESVALSISNGIDIKPVQNSRLVDISYTSPNPEFSALVANSVASAFIEQTLDMKMEATRGSLGWMTRKAEEERRKLEASERGLQDYMRAHNLVTLENRLAVVPQQLTETGGGLLRAEIRRKELEILYERARRAAGQQGLAETVPAIAKDDALRMVQTQILKGEQEIMELSGKYGSKHPLMIKAQSDIGLLKKRKEQEIARIIQSIRTEYELALAGEQSLREQMDATKTEAVGLNEKWIQYGVLKREVDTNRQLYDALMTKIKEQSLTDETQPVNLWIVEKASVPSRPARPNLTFNLLLGLGGGLVGGLGLVFLAEYLDRTVKSPQDVESLLHAPVIGVVCRLRGKDQEMEKIVLSQPLSVEAESYKAIRTSLLLSAAAGTPRRILVTSAQMGEGKTTTAVNLALALAQSEKRVVLIDGDLRKPRLHKIFRLNNSYGLSTYLAGASHEKILQRGPLPNLAVLTAGPLPPNPSELLSSSRLDQLLEGLGREFDVILCDSPPTVSVADSRIIGRLCDGSILVVQAHKTSYELARRALRTLSELPAPLLGVVVNGLEPKKSDYFNEYYAYYGEKPSAPASPMPER